MKDGRSWLRRYFRNYLLIGLIPAALLALLFIYTTLTSYRMEVDNRRYASFAQLVDSVDHLLGQMDLVANHISATEMDMDALDPADPAYSEQAATIAVQQLSACEEQMLWDVPVVLFLRGTATIYTSSGVMSYEAFQRMMSVHGNLDYTGFYTALSTVRAPMSLRLVRDWRPEAAAGDAMALLYPMPVMSPLPEATLCFFVSEAVLGSMLENCITDLPGSLHVINSAYQETLSCEGLTAAPAVTQLRGTGILQLNHDGRAYTAMRAVTGEGSMTLCYLTQADDFYRSLRTLYTVLGAAVAAVLTLAVLCAAVMTRRSYRPLRRLVNGIPAGDGVAANEFDIIQTHMDAVAEHNLSLNQQLARQRPMIIDACLGKLLLGKADTPEEADFLLRCAGIELSGRRAFVLLIGAHADTAEAAEDFLDSLRERLNLTLPGGGQAWAMAEDIDGLAAVLTLCPDGEEDPREAMTQAILDRAGAQWPVRLSAGAGRLCADALQLHESCMEALAVVREFLPGSQLHFACYDQAELSGQPVPFPTLDYALLNQSLKQADAAMAHRALEKIVADIRRTDSMLYAQCMCYDVINNILRTVQSLTPRYSAQKLHALCAFRTPEEFHRGAGQLIDDFCAQYASLRETRTSRIREDVLAYVAEHVFSYDFSLEQIAGHFSLSQSYLSRFFKQETGYTFTQYITFLRLDRAKRLLAETALPLKEIVTQVGYVDAASFVRKFKSYEGVTPGQWREMYRKE